MNDTRLRSVGNAHHLVQVAVAILLVGFPAGCIKNFGAGGTGEFVVPRSELREIRSTNLDEMAVVQPATDPATLPTTLPTTRPAQKVEVTIDQVRRWAIENNLDLKVELLNPTLARESLTVEEARFESLFFANASFSKTDSPTASRINASQAESLNAEVGVRIPLQTGGVIQFSLPLNRFETNNEFATLNPAHTADYVASLNQPLLRGAGFGVSAAPIRIAFYQYQRVEAATKLRVISILAAVDLVYWQLYADWETLEVAKAEYDLSVAQLERARRQVRAGTAADPEIVRAEAGVAASLQRVITADSFLRNQQRLIKRMIWQPGLEMDSNTIIIPATKPGVLFFRLDPHQLVKVALMQRMEMLDLELQLEQEQVNLYLARNDLLPLLDLSYSYSTSGLGPTYRQALEMANENDFDNHRVSLRLELPIGNAAARARLRRALASRMQATAARDLRAALITQEVLNALDKLETNWNQILAARKSVMSEQRVLEVETRQFGQGLRTSTDVLDAQTRLARAQLSEISAIANYQIAQVELATATGTVLGASKVIWEPVVMKK